MIYITLLSLYRKRLSTSIAANLSFLIPDTEISIGSDERMGRNNKLISLTHSYKIARVLLWRASEEWANVAILMIYRLQFRDIIVSFSIAGNILFCKNSIPINLHVTCANFFSVVVIKLVCDQYWPTNQFQIYYAINGSQWNLHVQHKIMYPYNRLGIRHISVGESTHDLWIPYTEDQ